MKNHGMSGEQVDQLLQDLNSKSMTFGLLPIDPDVEREREDFRRRCPCPWGNWAENVKQFKEEMGNGEDSQLR